MQLPGRRRLRRLRRAKNVGANLSPSSSSSSSSLPLNGEKKKKQDELGYKYANLRLLTQKRTGRELEERETTAGKGRRRRWESVTGRRRALVYEIGSRQRVQQTRTARLPSASPLVPSPFRPSARFLIRLRCDWRARWRPQIDATIVFALARSYSHTQGREKANILPFV